MGSIGSMGKPIEGFLVAAIQFPVPIVNSRKDIDHNIESIIRTLHATKAGYPGVELIIFPEYSTQGLNSLLSTSEAAHEKEALKHSRSAPTQRYNTDHHENSSTKVRA
ncbi:hypothetical protein HpBGD84_16750 [Helicobacter pylori]